MLFSAAVNEIMARIKIYYGKKENAVALISDGIHSRVDVWASLAVLFGLIFSRYWSPIDSVMAVFVGIYVIKESVTLGKEMTDSLLDVSAGDEVEEQIRDIVQKKDIKLLELKTQKKGLSATANINITLPEDLKVSEATHMTDELKDTLLREVEPLEYIAIQIESNTKKETETSSSYYEPKDMFSRFSHSRFHWSHSEHRHTRHKDTHPHRTERKPDGICYCQTCEYEKPHTKGTPCAEHTCPKCKKPLTRKTN